MVERRYGDVPAMLRVYQSDTPCIGDSITVVPGPGGRWYRSSTGDLLAPCARIEVAVMAVAVMREPWVALAASVRRTGGA